ncbi:hypothetical protein A2U01_0004813 [Trifolium medium]|uniref:Uncharacterized protein n=1 Tax=Trifolium medium TaxID=97028 RepID=A0A392MA17_9FABA|nr:hypothetical protein [Trifolium medium]
MQCLLSIMQYDNVTSEIGSGVSSLWGSLCDSATQLIKDRSLAFVTFTMLLPTLMSTMTPLMEDLKPQFTW